MENEKLETLHYYEERPGVSGCRHCTADRDDPKVHAQPDEDEDWHHFVQAVPENWR